MFLYYVSAFKLSPSAGSPELLTVASVPLFNCKVEVFGVLYKLESMQAQATGVPLAVKMEVCTCQS